MTRTHSYFENLTGHDKDNVLSRRPYIAILNPVSETQCQPWLSMILLDILVTHRSHYRSSREQ